MPSYRERLLSALFGQLQAIPHAVAKRNEALPQIVPAGGLIILRGGDPGRAGDVAGQGAAGDRQQRDRRQ